MTSKKVLSGKIPHDQFIKDGILKLRKDGHKGIHVVFSGFNAAFLEYYGVEARPFVDDLAKRGDIVLRPSRGGAIITLKEDAADVSPPASEVLAKILK